MGGEDLKVPDTLIGPLHMGPVTSMSGSQQIMSHLHLWSEEE